MKHLVFIGLILLGMVSGCRKAPDTDALRLAWAQVNDRQLGAAIPLIKEYLQYYPNSVAAHYMFGKCYLHRADANTTLAKGEIETALALLDRGNSPEFLTEIYPENKLRAMMHQDAALALMRAIYDASGEGLPEIISLPMIDMALEHVKEGLAEDPESSFLKEMEGTLKSLQHPVATPPHSLPAPRPAEPERISV